MSLSSLLEKITSIREGSSCRANARLTKRLQAVTLKLRKEVISALYKVGEGGAEDVPPPDPDVVAVL